MKRITLALVAVAAVLLLATTADAGGRLFGRWRQADSQQQQAAPEHQQWWVDANGQLFQWQPGQPGEWKPVQAPGVPMQTAQQAKPKAAPAIQWGDDYQTAIDTGITDNKLVVIFFTAKTCVHCPRQEAAFADPRVYAAMKDVIAVKVSTDDKPDLAAEYHVTTVPAVAFVSPDGKSNTFEGVQPADTLLAKLQPKQAKRK